MNIGVVIGEEDPSRFFLDICEDLASCHQVDLFQVRRLESPIFYFRVNRILLRHDLETFLKSHDVVFFEWASGLLATASHLPKRCQIVTRLHRYEMFQWVSRVNWAAVDRVILVSEAMRKKFSALFPAHVHKTVVIPVGVSTTKFQPHAKGESKGNIGTLCYIAPRKRVYELILSFYDLTRKMNGLHLHIAGKADPAQADYMDSIQHIIRELKMQDKVTFYGDVIEPWNWYRDINIFISNSYSEGAQVALMEAMSSGCYCISHHWEGAEEMLPEEYLFNTDSELQKKTLEFLQAPHLIQSEHQERMRAIACEKFDIEQTKTQIRAVLEKGRPGIIQ